MRKEILRVSHLKKNSPLGSVITDMNFSLYEGEILGILGMHDTGKSMLLEIISGRDEDYSGQIYLNERLMSNREELRSRHIALIRKESSLVGSMSIADNIFVLRKNKHFRFLLRKNLIEKQAKIQLAELGVNLDPADRVDSLPDEQRCIVEIVKAYILGAKLILINDLSNGYSNEASYELAIIVSKLRKRGVSFIIAGSQWSILAAFCDRIAIIDNQSICKIVESNENGKQTADCILQPDTKRLRDALDRKEEKQVVFACRHVTYGNIRDLSFEVRKGEVFYYRNASSHALEDLFELFEKPENLREGTLEAFSQPYRGPDNRIIVTDFDMNKRFFTNMSVIDNVCMMCYPKLSTFGVIRQKRISFLMKEFVKGLGNERLLLEKKCTRLKEKEKLAIYLFSIRMRNPKFIVCANIDNAVDYETDSMIRSELQYLSQHGTAVLNMSSKSAL